MPTRTTTSQPRLAARPPFANAHPHPPLSPRPTPQSEQKTPRRLRHSREQPFRIRARPLHRPPRSAAPARFLGSPSPSYPPASRWLSASPEPRRRPGRRARARALSPGAQPSDLLLSTPVSERLPLIWDRRPLCAWRVLHPRTSVPKERTCTKRCGPASREAPSCTPGPATHPTPALRLPGGALVYPLPPGGVSQAGRARLGGAGTGRSGARTEGRGARTAVAPPGHKCAAAPAGFSVRPRRSGRPRGWPRTLGRRRGPSAPRRSSSLSWPRAKSGGAGRAALRPRKAGGAGTRVS